MKNKVIKSVKKLNTEFKAVKIKFKYLYPQHMDLKESWKNYVKSKL